MSEQSKVVEEKPVEEQASCCSNESCCGPKTPAKRETPKIGRNDPCFCGSGNKYKKCCG